jgi:hypothetical protein
MEELRSCLLGNECCACFFNIHPITGLPGRLPRLWVAPYNGEAGRVFHVGQLKFRRRRHVYTFVLRTGTRPDEPPLPASAAGTPAIRNGA